MDCHFLFTTNDDDEAKDNGAAATLANVSPPRTTKMCQKRNQLKWQQQTKYTLARRHFSCTYMYIRFLRFLVFSIQFEIENPYL